MSITDYEVPVVSALLLSKVEGRTKFDFFLKENVDPMELDIGNLINLTHNFIIFYGIGFLLLFRLHNGPLYRSAFLRQ